MTIKLIVTIKDGQDILYRNDAVVYSDELNNLVPQLNAMLRELDNTPLSAC